ncbi:MAG: putative sulfate exporter family transporter [Desulfuromonas sp.]|nr:MAG: putative sulfate exporter family transporter [Desulfuromonas sp.]
MSLAAETKQRFVKVGFVGLFMASACPMVSSPVALVAGFIFALWWGNPYQGLTARSSKTLLKLSVVGLGFGVNFIEVIEVGKSSLPLTLISISATLLLGALIGRALQLPGNIRTLISFGTAICGGSAIAAMAPVIKAENEEVAVSLATVFALNAVGLVLFPPLGHWVGLDQRQFGIWAALAIHDTSSVVGAAATFGAIALAVGTTVKLTRALWIVPCTLLAGMFHESKPRVSIPLFIVGFLVAAFVNSWLPEFKPLWGGLHGIAKQTLVMTLFLIGASLTRQTLQRVGLKPLLMGALLWVCVMGATLAIVLKGYV